MHYIIALLHRLHANMHNLTNHINSRMDFCRENLVPKQRPKPTINEYKNSKNPMKVLSYTTSRVNITHFSPLFPLWAEHNKTLTPITLPAH